MTNNYNDKEISEVLMKFPISEENERATQELLRAFPEFKNSEFYGQTDKSLPYLVFADFSRFLSHRAKDIANLKSDDLISRAGKFTSELFNSGIKDLKDLISGGIFENLAEDENMKPFLEVLSDEAGELYKKFL